MGAEIAGQLYIWALAASKWANLRQSVLLARHGAYEVRLFDPNRDLRSESIPFWLELFDQTAMKTTADRAERPLKDNR
jgi:hypothetical protein